MRYLGIDYGSKKVGLALSDEAGVMGFPHKVVPNTPRLADELARLIQDEGVGAIVMGDSRDFSGEPNPVAEAARAFAEELSRATGVPVHYESETFTSAEARRMPEKQMKSRSPQSFEAVDASAAALILTSYLSHPHD